MEPTATVPTPANPDSDPLRFPVDFKRRSATPLVPPRRSPRRTLITFIHLRGE